MHEGRENKYGRGIFCDSSRWCQYNDAARERGSVFQGGGDGKGDDMQLKE